MTNEQYQVLCAAILESVEEIHGHYTGSAEELAEYVMTQWPANYGSDDVLECIDILTKLKVTEKSSFLSSSFIAIDHAVAMRRLRNGSGMPVHPARVVPLLHEYAKFGKPWLDQIWSRLMSADPDQGPSENVESGAIDRDAGISPIQDPDAKTGDDGDAADQPVTSEARQALEASYDSGAWTGIKRVQVTSENREAVLGAIDKAIVSLDTMSLSNLERAQVVALLGAAKTLAEAPEPPSVLIWDLIERAGAICGILGLFITLLAASV
ncbi:MAG TPA: hypothetical protein VD846_01230 [Allosphingosinicella sp.]|nr:hypothetical protein [Allosphingosinicella sp.]